MLDTFIVDPDNNPIPFQIVDGTAEIGAPGFEENVFNITQDSKEYHVIVFSNSTVTSFNFDQTYKQMTFNVSGLDATLGSSWTVFSKEILSGTFAVLVDNNAIYYSMAENKTHNFLHFKYEHTTRAIKILLTVTGDLDGDRKVSMKDVYLVILAFGSEPGDPNWNPIADIVPDDKISMADIYKVILNFGEEWSPI
jgi:hypothetical protein